MSGSRALEVSFSTTTLRDTMRRQKPKRLRFGIHSLLENEEKTFSVIYIPTDQPPVSQTKKDNQTGNQESYQATEPID